MVQIIKRYGFVVYPTNRRPVCTNQVLGIPGVINYGNYVSCQLDNELVALLVAPGLYAQRSNAISRQLSVYVY